jgi:CO/xanthine dehydrogenase Mo-binding subunit
MMGTPSGQRLKIAQPPAGTGWPYFEALPEEFLIRDGAVHRRSGENGSMDYAELLRRTGRERLEGTGSHRNSGGLDAETGLGIASSHWHQGAGAVEVEVDPETGKVEILHCHSCTYAGRVINLSLAELQNEGNMIFGLGSALFEEIVFDEGQVSNPNLSDYQIPDHGPAADDPDLTRSRRFLTGCRLRY